MHIFDSFKDKILDSRAFVQKHQRFIPVFSFFAGFTWDSVTITRIDEVSDNLIIGLYLILLGFLIILTLNSENNRLKKPLLIKYSQWYPTGIQFFLGGLFSAYVVFYFKSASFTKTAIFLGFLILLLVVNEFLKNKLTNTYLVISLYFLASFSFFIFFIPVITGYMNMFTFIAGSLAGLMPPLLILSYLYRKKLISSKKQYQKHLGLIGGIFFIMIFIHQLNLIPPVPLAMKYAGIYHHVSKNSTENIYLLKYEKPAWYQFFQTDDAEFHYQENDSVFCFASVFAPTRLTKAIAHEWQYYSEIKGEWIVTDRTTYRLTGGREGGYRGYTFKKNLEMGEWRVDIITDDDQILGRINFESVSAKKEILEFESIEK
jgi:predicted small secreted protein